MKEAILNELEKRAKRKKLIVNYAIITIIVLISICIVYILTMQNGGFQINSEDLVTPVKTLAIQENPEGRYMGYIIRNKKDTVLVLLNVHNDGNNLSCTLYDYPYYNYDKEEFTMYPEKDVWNSNYGKFVFIGDSLLSVQVGKLNNLRTWKLKKF